MTDLPARATCRFVPEQTWGLAEAHLTFPIGWANEKHHGSTRLAVELFGRGTNNKRSEEIQRELQALSCSIDASASAFQSRVSLVTHEDKLLDTVELALELIQQFAVDDAELSRVKARLDSENRSVREDPDVIADLALRRALWPEGREAYGSAGRASKRGATTAEHISNRWHEIVQTPPLILGCATNETRMQDALAKLASHATNGNGTEAGRDAEILNDGSIGAAPSTAGALHVPSSSGAECVRIARVLPTLGGRERAIIALLNFALVGGFMGALYKTLRTELHLVYAVSTNVSYAPDYTLWVAEVSPSPGRGADVLDALPAAFAGLQELLCDESQFDELVSRFVAHHVHRVSSWRGRFLGIRSDLEQGRPADERRRLPERVSVLTSAEVVDFLDRWNHAAEPRTVSHVGDSAPAGRSWTVKQVSELAPKR